MCRTGRTEERAQKASVSTGLEIPVTTLPSGLDFRARFVGRSEELEKIKLLFRSCREGNYLCFVTLVGPPGVGKTRLAEEAATEIRAEEPQTVVLRGSCGGPGAPAYAAFDQILADLAGVEKEDRPPEIRSKLTQMVGQWVSESRVTEVTHLLAQMMQCPYPASAVVEPLADSPAQLEMRIFLAVKRLLSSVAARKPLVLLLDNVERASSETVNLLHYLAAVMSGSGVLVIAVGRPSMLNLHPQWGEGEFDSAKFELEPLSPAEAQELLEAVLSDIEALPEALVHTVRHQFDRHPRTIEELVRYLLEVDILKSDDEGWHLDRDLLAALEIPTSHEDIVEERLRSLDPSDLEVLEKAAICGETFWLDLVVALYRVATLEKGGPDGPDLDAIAASGDRNQTSVMEALRRHVSRGFLLERRNTQIQGEKEFRFAYPPIWRLVYDKVDDDRLAYHHRLVAQWLELRPEGRSGSHQEEVGRHLELAEEKAAAAQRYRRAADMARASYFNEKAVGLYRQALDCIGETNISTRIHLWHDLGSVYELQGDYEKALEAFEKMLRLGWVMASRAKGGVAFNKMGRIWRQKGELSLALDYLKKGKDLFEQAGDTRGIAGSLDDIGQVLYLQGRYEEALGQSAAALEQRRRIGDLRSIAVSLSNVGNIERDRGLLNEAAACYEEALSLRREINDRVGIVNSLHSLAQLEFIRGDTERARSLWLEALSVAEAIGALPMQAQMLIRLGEAALQDAQVSEARQRIDEAIGLCRDLDEKRSITDALALMSLVELEEGHTDKARELGNEALQMARKGGIKEYVGKACLTLAHVHSKTLFDSSGGAQGKSAESYFNEAIDTFRELGNEAELARALAAYGGYAAERANEENARAALEESKALLSKLGMKGWRETADLLQTLQEKESAE
jgi:predicted ATPase